MWVREEEPFPKEDAVPFCESRFGVIWYPLVVGFMYMNDMVARWRGLMVRFGVRRSSLTVQLIMYMSDIYLTFTATQVLSYRRA